MGDKKEKALYWNASNLHIFSIRKTSYLKLVVNVFSPHLLKSCLYICCEFLFALHKVVKKTSKWKSWIIILISTILSNVVYTLFRDYNFRISSVFVLNFLLWCFETLSKVKRKNAGQTQHRDWWDQNPRSSQSRHCWKEEKATTAEKKSSAALQHNGFNTPPWSIHNSQQDLPPPSRT